MACQAKDAVFLVLFLVCENLVYSNITTNATTTGTPTSIAKTTYNSSNISSISDNFTSPFLMEASSSISSEEESQSWTDQLSYSSMTLNTQEFSSFSNLMRSEYSSIPYTAAILSNSDNYTFSDSIWPVYSSIPYTATILSNSDNSTSSDSFWPEYSSIPYTATILSNSDNSTSSDSIWAEYSSIPYNATILSNSDNSTSTDSIWAEYSSIPHTSTILSNSDNSTSPFVLEATSSISSEEVSEFWTNQVSYSTMMLSTQEFSSFSNLMGSEYSSIPFTSIKLSNSDSSTLSDLMGSEYSSIPYTSIKLSNSDSSTLSDLMRSKYSSIPYTATILSNSGNSTSSFALEATSSISSEESSQSWIEQLSYSSMLLSTQEFTFFSNLIGSQYSSVPYTATDLLENTFTCILDSCDTSVHFPSTSTQSATYFISSRTLQPDVFQSFKPITIIPFFTSQISAFSSVELMNSVTSPTISTPTKQQTTTTVGETIIYPTFKPLAVYEFTFVFILSGDFDKFETSNQKDKLKDELEKQLMEKIFKDTDLTEVHVSNFSKGSIVCDIVARVKKFASIDKSMDIILNNVVANARSINTTFGACDVNQTIERIASSIKDYKANPEKYVQNICPKSYDYQQDGECHHACEHKGKEFCGSNGECVYSGKENVAVCQCSEEPLYIYHGDKCEERTPKLTFYLAVTLGVGGGVVVIFLITIICLACRRVRLKKGLKVAYDDQEEWSLPNESVAMRNLSFRYSKNLASPENLYYRPAGQLNKAYESIVPDEVIMPVYFPPKSDRSSSRHQDDTESRRQSLKNIDTSQTYSIRRPKVSMEPNELYYSIKGPRL